jgi:hypothetical protein
MRSSPDVQHELSAGAALCRDSPRDDREDQSVRGESSEEGERSGQYLTSRVEERPEKRDLRQIV